MESTCRNAKDYGYAEGDLFIYAHEGSISAEKDAVFQLLDDDGTDCPVFRALHTSGTPFGFGPDGTAGCYICLRFVRPVGYYEVLGYLLDHYTQARALKIMHDLYGDEDTIESMLELADL